MRADGIHVVEGNETMSSVRIADSVIITHTHWRCPGCARTYQKRGIHTGRLITCRGCGVRFFLRR
jgi:DNA-directed RNA polymerase subunit RPC12/RpoP